MGEKGNRGTFRRAVRAAGSFLCALAISAAVLVSAGLFMATDGRVKASLGDAAPMFSYEVVDLNRARITAFGESVTVNYKIMGGIREKAAQAVDIGEGFAPSAAGMITDVFLKSAGGVASVFAALPDTLRALYERVNAGG